MGKNKFFIIFLLLTLTVQVFGSVNRYVVLFTDKDGSAYSTSNPEEFLTERAIHRRTKQNIKISFNDLPVSEQYINTLKSISDLDLYYQTKWLNGILVEMDESMISDIESYPFVKKVDLVALGGKLGVNVPNGRTSEKEKKENTEYEGAETSEQNIFIGVDEMHQMGYRGENMLIAVFDSGFGYVDGSSYFEHLFEGKRLKASRDFIRGSNNIFITHINSSGLWICQQICCAFYR